ncbi:MAG: hypothetical protein ACI4EH_05705 [Oliverpabstia sp.]
MNKKYEEIDGKLYIYVETTEEGIADYYNSARYMPELRDTEVRISRMRVKGEWVPAFLVEEKDPEAYAEYKRQQWREEDAWKRENRCDICGEKGKSRRCPVRVKNPDYTGAPGEKKTLAVDCSQCPYDKLFRPIKGNVLFTTLTKVDEDGNESEYEPEDYGSFEGRKYERLSGDFVKYLRKEYPKYAELVEILSSEIDLKTAAKMIGKPYNTVYGWLKRLRLIYDEFRKNVAYL